jgi:hypothetical protein
MIGKLGAENKRQISENIPFRALKPPTRRCFRESPVNQVILGKRLGK